MGSVKRGTAPAGSEGNARRLTVGEVAAACRTARICLECGENPTCWTAELLAGVRTWTGADRAAVVFPASDTLLGDGLWAALRPKNSARGLRIARCSLLETAQATAETLPSLNGSKPRAVSVTAVLSGTDLPAVPPPTLRAGPAGDARVSLTMAWRDLRGRVAVLLVGAALPTRADAERTAAEQAAAEQIIATGGRLSKVAARELAAAGRRLSHPGDASPDALTPRARTVLHHWVDGLLEKEVAGVLEVSDGTVHKQVHRIYRHFNVSSRGELQALFLRRGWARRRRWRNLV